VNEVWVTWHEQPNLFFSPPTARVYTIERSRGRLLFGGAGTGLAPVAAADNVVARRYRSGGGTIGNVSRGAITQLLAGVLAQSVSNPRAAEGGADGQPIQDVLARGSAIVHHRRQAITAADYEALARDASPAVAVARALPTTHPSGRFAPGWVTMLIVPRSTDAQPVASFELRDRVRRFLSARAPAAIATQIAVIPAAYYPVGVSITVRPLDRSSAGIVAQSVTTALATFLHPLTGGPDGNGWPFGRDIFLSDVAALVESLPGVDFATSISLLVNGTPVGERVAVPPDRIVVAGVIRVSLFGGEG
jgi:predicted phage baseplate assembly protein